MKADPTGSVSAYDLYKILKREAIDSGVFDLENVDSQRRWCLNHVNWMWLSRGEKSAFLSSLMAHVHRRFGQFATDLNAVDLCSRHVDWALVAEADSDSDVEM